MTPTMSHGLKLGAVCLIASAWQFATIGAAQAQTPAPAPAGAAPAAEAAPAGPTALTTPVMNGPLVANPDPIHFDPAPFTGVYLSGAASGLILRQSDRVFAVGDHDTTVDLTNAQVSLQNTEGVFQFFLEPGAYSLPTVGVPYQFTKVGTATNLFGGLPVAWGKVIVNNSFNIQGGKLPTLIGVESMFTFQNMNIERGLLWNQEPIVSRGVQANLTTGPVAWALSLNDGYYSGQYNWLSGAATWTIDSANTVVFTGGGALSRNTGVSPATPTAQNNSFILEASYTYNNAPWTITPYIQYTHVSSDAAFGFGQDASTLGGAILASYKFTDNISLAGRWEYIGSSGSVAGGAPDLLGYGPGSAAMSFTLTPTWQAGPYFIRAEGSLTQLYSITPGATLVFGTGNSKTQGRFLVETGVVF